MKARVKYKFSTAEREAMNDTILQELKRVDEKRACLCDCIILLTLYKYYGFRKKRLRQFWNHYNELETELQHYYETLPPEIKKGELELNFYAQYELKRAGVDVEHWREAGTSWNPDTDECWRNHR